MDGKVSMVLNRDCFSKMKDFSRIGALQAVTYSVKVVVSKKWHEIDTLLHKHLGGAEFKAYMPPTTKASMFVTPVTKEKVLEIIWKFKNHKSPGPDSTGPRLLKEVINEIIDPLVYLFNLSFSTGLVPESLKLAKVIPVYKKSDRSYVGNYRPIPLLSIFDKILEKAMCARLCNYLTINNILYDYQFGFRKYYSTCLALIDIIDNIYQHLDKQDLVLGLYLDLQKAFDTVDHRIKIRWSTN